MDKGMDKSSRMSKMRSRLNHAQEVLKKADSVLEGVQQTKNEQFGDTQMTTMAKQTAEGLNLATIDELRSMKMQPPPVVEIVVRCICTLASGDDLGDAEFRANEKAREAAEKKAAALAIAKGLPP